MDRRTLLVSAGGLLGLGAVHQRRRLRRWSDRDALLAARALKHPDPAFGTHLTVTEAHLESAVADLETALEEARDARAALEGSVDDESSNALSHADSRIEIAARKLETGRAELDAFATLSADERLSALDDLRIGLSAAGEATAAAALERGDLDADAIEAELEAVDDEHERVARELTYRDREDALSRAVVAYAELDERLIGVRQEIASGRRFRTGANPNLPFAYAAVPSARGQLADVERFAAQLADEAGADAANLESTLEDRYATLRERIDATVDGIDFEYDGRAAHAVDLWNRRRTPSRLDGTDYHSQGRLALAVRSSAEEYTYALALEAFADVPSVGGLRDDDHDRLAETLETTGDDVRAAKRRAVDALETRLGEEGDDPLVRYSCTDLVADLEWRNRQVDRALDDINAGDSADWTLTLEKIRLGYLEIAELAAVLPEVLAVVDDG